MRHKWMLVTAVVALFLQMPPAVLAFECPAHFAEAQAAIDRADEQIKRMEGGMALAAVSHLREARMSLVEAKHHHTQEGNYHHGRAIVRANEARGHAVAAYIMSRNRASQ